MTPLGAITTGARFAVPQWSTGAVSGPLSTLAMADNAGRSNKATP